MCHSGKIKWRVLQIRWNSEKSWTIKSFPLVKSNYNWYISPAQVQNLLKCKKKIMFFTDSARINWFIILIQTLFKAFLDILWIEYLFFLFFNLQDSSLPSGEKTIEGFSITLDKVDRHQAGVYQCTASNGVGDPVTVDMQLDVLCKYLCKVI